MNIANNNISVRERSDDRFEARITIDEKSYSRYGKTASEAKKKIELLLTKIAKGNVIVKAIKLNTAM